MLLIFDVWGINYNIRMRQLRGLRHWLNDNALPWYSFCGNFKIEQISELGLTRVGWGVFSYIFTQATDITDDL